MHGNAAQHDRLVLVELRPLLLLLDLLLLQAPVCACLLLMWTLPTEFAATPC
jgi:hypothetical protein